MSPSRAWATECSLSDMLDWTWPVETHVQTLSAHEVGAIVELNFLRP